MNALHEAEQQLQSRGVRCERTADSIRYVPEEPDGFEPMLSRGDGEFTVSFAGWHEPFNSIDEALRCFTFGLSECCRLRVLSRGSIDYRWTVQARREGRWEDDSETGLLIFPFWLRRRERYLQNHVIRDATETA